MMNNTWLLNIPTHTRNKERKEKKIGGSLEMVHLELKPEVISLECESKSS